MRVTIIHRGKTATHRIGWQLALGGDPASDNGIRPQGRGPWTGTLEASQGEWRLGAAGLPWSRNGLQISGVTVVEPGDVIAIGEDRILIEYTEVPLPATPPLDEIERTLLARIGAERTDDHAARVLADHWQEGRDEPRGAMVQQQREGHAASELIATHGARWRRTAEIAGFESQHLELWHGFARGSLVLRTDEPLARCPDGWRLSPRQYIPVRRLARARHRTLTEALARTLAGERGRFVLKGPAPPELDDNPIDEDLAMLAKLDHPNVIQLFDLAVTRDGFAMVMPWAGTALDELLRPPRRPDEPLAIALGLQLVEALIALRDAQIIHKQIEPSHILVAEDGHVTLGGFSMASTIGSPRPSDRRVSGRLRHGSFTHMSPEQVRGLASGAPSDLFSLCMTLDTLALGYHPLRHAQSDFDTLLAIRDLDIAMPINTPFADILRRTMVREPADRPTLEDFRDALAGIDPGRAPLLALFRG